MGAAANLDTLDEIDREPWMDVLRERVRSNVQARSKQRMERLFRRTLERSLREP